MSRNTVCRLRVLIFAMVVCLMLPACRTCTETAYDDATVSAATLDTRCKLKEIIIPEMAFPLHATLTDAVEFLRQASREYDSPWRLSGERGVRFDLRLPSAPQPADPFVGTVATNLVHAMFAAVSVRSISLQDALQLICEVSRQHLRWDISEDGTVVIAEKVWPPKEDFVTRSYPVPEDLDIDLFNRHDTKASDIAPNKVWEQFFEQLGVKRPVYHTVGVQCTCGKTHRDLTEYDYEYINKTLRVTNTPDNMAIIDQVFDIFALRMVEVEMQIHAFRTADIEQVRLSDGVSLESLMALRKNGKSKLVASATALTKSGQETIVKAVQEEIYPTELLTNVSQAGSNVTVRSVANALIPSYTMMRETGIILQIVPEIQANKVQVFLTLKPQWVTLDRWESYPAYLATGWMHTTRSFKQPVFGVTGLDSQAMMKDGETQIIASSSTPDGEWLNVGFLTTRLRNVQPDLSDHRTDKVKEQISQKDAEVLKKLKRIVIPEVAFRPPATIFDAIRFFRDASIRYDKVTIPKAQRGVSFVLKLPVNTWELTQTTTKGDPFVAPAFKPDSYIPTVPTFSACFLSLYDALKLVCDITQMKFSIRDGVVWILPDISCDECYTTRIYPVPSAYSSVSSGNWEQFLEQRGVRLAVGSSLRVKNLSSVNLLSVTSSRKTQAEMEQALENLIHPRNVEVDVQIHAFTTEDIEKLRLSDDFSIEALIALRKKGKAKQVASASVLIKSGQEAILKAVQEMVYPTALLTEVNQAECNIELQSAPRALVPGNFTTREMGMTLQVVPEVSSDQPLINVTMKSSWVTLERWEPYPANKAVLGMCKTRSFKQPIFRTTSFETQALVKAGETVLLGSSSSPDGKWVHVGFLTVKECR